MKPSKPYALNKRDVLNIVLHAVMLAGAAVAADFFSHLMDALTKANYGQYQGVAMFALYLLGYVVKRFVQGK